MNSKISELDLVSVVDQNDVLPIVNGGITKKVKFSQLEQDLQSVTDKGATTTNSIIVETVFPNADAAISGISLSGEGVYGSSSETNGVHGVSISGAGVYGESNDGSGVYGISQNDTGVYGISTNSAGVYGESNDAYGVYGYSDNSIGVYGVSTNNISVYGNSETGVGLSAYSGTGIPIETYGNGNGTPSVEVNLGNTNKGLVIESGTSSIGNPIEVKKNGVLKFRVAQNGDVTTDVISANGDVLTLEAGATKIEINDLSGDITVEAGNFNLNCPISTSQISSGRYLIPALNTAPATATSPGALGEIRYTAGFIYVCIATNTWRRTALTAW
jgi:hypothetical protein